MSYTYDDDGLLIQAGDMSLTRDPQTGFLTGTMLGVVTTSYTYSPFGELATMSAEVSGTPIYTTTYTRDKLGRITTKVEMIQGVTKTYDYAYDPAGRLDTVTIDGILEADYDYDLNGNRLSKTTPGGTETGTYDDQDRMLTYGGAMYTYTANGEMLTKTDGADVTSYDYDVFGNLLGVDRPNATAIDYVVDAKNRRIGRKVGGVLTQGLLWQSQLAPIAELDGVGNLASRFVHATRINVPDYLVRGGSTYRNLTDHLGSPRLVIDTTTGAVAQRIDYDEWGIVLQDTNPGWTPFGFAGGEFETATGLLRFGARDFAGSHGRWLGKDWLLFRGGSPSLVTYSSNDPVNLVDSDGLKCTNNSPFWVPVKPEDPGRSVEWLPPGEEFDGPIDGARPPAWDGDWFKVSDFTDITIEPDGTASASGPGAMLFPPTFPDHILAPTPTVPYPHPTGYDFFDHLPGRKGPGWDVRHPDWNNPDPPVDCNCE